MFNSPNYYNTFFLLYHFKDLGLKSVKNFVGFLEYLKTRKNSCEINWPLVKNINKTTQSIVAVLFIVNWWWTAAWKCCENFTFRSCGTKVVICTGASEWFFSRMIPKAVPFIRAVVKSSNLAVLIVKDCWEAPVTWNTEMDFYA